MAVTVLIMWLFSQEGLVHAGKRAIVFVVEPSRI